MGVCDIQRPTFITGETGWQDPGVAATLAYQGGHSLLTPQHDMKGVFWQKAGSKESSIPSCWQGPGARGWPEPILPGDSADGGGGS